MKFSSLFLFSGSLISMFLFEGCSTESDIIMPSDKEIAIERYTEVAAIPTKSLLSFNTESSRSERFGKEIKTPYLSATDLEIISSQNELDCLNLKKRLLNMVGKDSMDMEVTEDDLCLKLFKTMGSVHCMNQLKEFANEYIKAEGGLKDFTSLVPNDIKKSHIDYYVAIALYIDRIGRPLYDYIVKYNVVRSRNAMCDFAAEASLVTAGYTFGLETFVGLMTGVEEFELAGDAIVLTADLVDIWIKYEQCNGRWH